jgi:hypothetical protein
MRHEVLDHVLVAQPVAAADGVVEMMVEAVVARTTLPTPLRLRVVRMGTTLERADARRIALGRRAAAVPLRRTHDVRLNRSNPAPVSKNGLVQRRQRNRAARA